MRLKVENARAKETENKSSASADAHTDESANQISRDRTRIDGLAD